MSLSPKPSFYSVSYKGTGAGQGQSHVCCTTWSTLGSDNRGRQRATGKGEEGTHSLLCVSCSSTTQHRLSIPAVAIRSCSSCRVHFVVLPALGEPTSPCSFRGACISRSPRVLPRVPPPSSDTPAPAEWCPLSLSCSSERPSFQPHPGSLAQGRRLLPANTPPVIP